MKVAVVSNPRHRAGDLIEFLMLRAVHTFHRFVPVDLLMIEGEFGDAEEGFLSELFRSIKHRKVTLPIIWLPHGTGWNLPPAPEAVDGNGQTVAPAVLLERIRAAAGGYRTLCDDRAGISRNRGLSRPYPRRLLQ